MELKIVYSEEMATADVDRLLDSLDVFPKQRERLQNAVEAVIEGMMYGYVSIAEDGTIKHTLRKPIASPSGGQITELDFCARVSPEIMDKAISSLKIDTPQNRCMCYVKAYTGQLESTIKKLYPADRNIADCIALFFM